MLNFSGTLWHTNIESVCFPSFNSCPAQDFSFEVAKVQECVFLHMNSKKFAV